MEANASQQSSQTFGQYLKQLREKNGFSLRDVETATGISNAYLSLIENDKIKKPAPNNVHKLAGFFKVDLRELLSLAGILEANGTTSRPANEYVFSKANLLPGEEEELIQYLKFIRMRNETNYNPTSADDIEKVVYNVLKQSNSFDTFPTPVKQIIDYAELTVDKKQGLHNIPNHYISKKIDVLKNALAKVFGALDRRQKIIYLNPEMKDGKKAFVQLHEVGHHSLPWQRDVLEYVEDENSLSPDVQELFEAEANYFASASLFQLERFDREISTLPLSLTSIRLLANKYGASLQATFRRYVEKSSKRVALFVLHKPTTFGEPLKVRNWFVSEKFQKDFPNLDIPPSLSKELPFVKDYYYNRRWIDQPNTCSLTTIEEDDYDFEYRYCFNGIHVFVLITPRGEKVASRTTIFVQG